MSNALDPSTSTTSSASPSTRRSTRPKRSSDTPKPRLFSSVWDTPISGSRGTLPTLGDSTPRRKNLITPSNPHPWMHPQELRYISDKDFPQNILIQYLCSKAFSIPPRETNSTIPLFNVMTSRGTAIGLPRGYRVPLMFVAKFQWDSLKLVLTSPDPQKEWDEYKFDIIHLCRLCERLFVQATEAQKQVVAAGAKGIDRLWRSATFDRVLTRFYHRWFVSREWSIRKFWEEFDDDEYDGDILKHDWARWAVKGHKGFVLTKAQIQGGITAQQFMHGLSKNSHGTWVWDESLPLPLNSGDSDSLSSTREEHPIVVEDGQNSNGTTIAQLEKVFDVRVGTGTPSHNTIEVKKERLEVAGESLSAVDKPSSGSASILPVVVPTNLESVCSGAVTASVTPVVDAAERTLSNNDTNIVNTDKPLRAAERSTSPIVGQKRPRTSISGVPFSKRTKFTARKTAPRPRPKSQKSTSFGSYLGHLGLLFGNNTFSDDSSDSSEESSSSGCDDDPNDGDYRGPRKSKAKARQLPPKSGSKTRLDPVSNTSPLTVIVKVPPPTSVTDSRSTGPRFNPPVIATEFRVIPALTKGHGSPKGVALPSTTSIKPNTSNPPEEPELPVPDQVTSSLPSVTELAMAGSESPDITTATATRTKIALSSDAKAPSTSEIHELAPTPSTSELVCALSPLPAPLSPQDGAPTSDNLSNSNCQNNSAVPAPSHSTSRGTVADQLPQVSETNAETVLEEAVVKENIPDFPVAEVEMNGGAGNTVTTDVVGDRSVHRDAILDLPKSLATAEPCTQAIDEETSLHLEGVRPGALSLTSSVSKEDDHMDVDEPAPTSDRVVDQRGMLASLLSDKPTPTSDRVVDLHGMLASLLSDPREIKVRRAMLLLRGLLRDQQIQACSIHTAVDGENNDIPARHSSPSDARHASEQRFTMEEHLELVVKCSSLLSEYATVYKGRELEERMIELDERLEQELSNTGNVHNLATMPVRARSRSPIRVDKEVATEVHEDHSELLNHGQEIVGDKQVEESASILQDPATETVALTPEATMVDLSSVGPTSTDSDILKIELLSGTVPPATRLMTSMMRNLADLLDCTYGGDSNDVKGKGRALDMISPTTIGMPYDLPVVSPLLNEFKSVKEEMRKSQQRSKEEIESITRLHRAELTSLKEQMRATEDKYRRETELLSQRHREEMDLLMGSLRGVKKQGEKAILEAEGKPLLEVLELRRRITALEGHSRSVTHSPSQAGPSSRPVCEDESDITIIRRPPFHPLGHLFDYEDAASFRSSPDGVTSASKPGTPIQSEPSNAVFMNSIPLPIKSQRKFQSMHRMSLT